jgi:hypothetical protein
MNVEMCEKMLRTLIGTVEESDLEHGVQFIVIQNRVVLLKQILL